MTNLPGSGGNNPNPPSLPNTKPAPPSDATAQAVAWWNATKDIRPAIEALGKLLREHPEFIEWAKSSGAGTMKL